MKNKSKNQKIAKNGQKIWKSWKISKINNNKKKIFSKKKCYTLSFPILGGRNSTRALQSTPFKNPGGVPWAWRSPKDKGRKSLCLILDSV